MKRILVLLFLVLGVQALIAQGEFAEKLALAAAKLANDRVVYDPSYFRISYPNGDVPTGKGVCTDVVVRAYRAVNIDLQERVHEDMKRNFDKYPKLWGLSRPDANIDHRRVPNLMTYFTRHGKTLATTTIASDYLPGDIVTWKLDNGLLHIGIVIPKKSGDDERHLVVHNIGRGQEISDCLFSYKIVGHYRYTKP